MGDYKGEIVQQEYKGVITQSEYKGVLSITDPMTVIEKIAQEIASGTSLAEKVADCYPALYSMKKTWRDADKCLRLRKSNDDDESDFGFVNGEVDNAGIISWLAGADGYCKTWYDQSGNGNDAGQSDSREQPQYDTSEKCLKFDGIDFFGLTNPYTFTNNNTLIMRFSSYELDDYRSLFGKDAAYSYFRLGNKNEDIYIEGETNTNADIILFIHNTPFVEYSWYNLAFTEDGSNNWNLYVDNSGAYPNDYGSTTDSEMIINHIALGYSTNLLIGGIKAFIINNKLLSQTQIQNINNFINE